MEPYNTLLGALSEGTQAILGALCALLIGLLLCYKIYVAITRTDYPKGWHKIRLYNQKLFKHPVAKVVAEYSAEEKMRFREQFAPVAQRFRQIQHPMLVFVVGSFLFTSIAASILHIELRYPKNMREWIGWTFLGCSVPLLLAVIIFAIPWFLIRCPACHNRLISPRLGHYCPACGSSQLEEGDWLVVRRCKTCGKYVGRVGWRRYKIRACTHCGVILDEIGL